jgi:hypothetical protein
MSITTSHPHPRGLGEAARVVKRLRIALVLLGDGRYRNSTADGTSTTRLHGAVTLTAVD